MSIIKVKKEIKFLSINQEIIKEGKNQLMKEKSRRIKKKESICILFFLFNIIIKRIELKIKILKKYRKKIFSFKA